MNGTIRKDSAYRLPLMGGAALAALLAATPLQAGESALGYMNMGVAAADVEALDTGVTGILGLGFPMPGIDPRLSLEGEFSKSVFGARGRDFQGFDDSRERFNYFTLSGYATYHLPVATDVDLRGRGGMTYLDWDFGGVSSDEIGLSIGVGATYRLSRDMNLLGDLTIMETSPDVNHFTVGVQYRLD